MREKEVDRYAQKLQIQAFDQKLNKGIGTNWELIFDPEFRQIYFSKYPYLTTAIFIAIESVDYYFRRKIDFMTLLFLFAVVSQIVTTFFQAKLRLKISVFERALELYRQQKEVKSID
jgi:hypothetical protein